MKIAYLMTVHKNPQLLKRAIGTLSSEDCAFFIHVDRKADIQEFSAIGGDNIFFSEQRMPVYWGEFSQVEATMQLIRQSLASSENYEYFVFLQGSDYPLRSGRYIKAFLENNSGREFINLVRMPAPGFPLSKVNKLTYASDKPVRRFIARLLGKLGLAHRDYRRHLAWLEAYAGNACWTLSRNAVQYVMEFSTSNPDVQAYFQNAFTSDEMFFHTIVGNSQFLARVRRNLVYVDWHAGNHPDMVNDRHLRFFESQDKVWVDDEWGSGEVLFARKFSDDNMNLVDRVDKMIRRKEKHAEASLTRPYA